MAHTLFPHQEQALRYAQQRDHIALFMEMRLGKSVVAIRWAQPFHGRRLVVAPLSTLKGWEQELRDEGETDVVWLTGISARARASLVTTAAHRWHLINYEALRSWHDAPSIRWSCLIVDESTRIRNPKALITKMLTRKFFDVPHRAILTGLPN